MTVSPVSLDELEQLKVSAGFTAADGQSLRLAGEVLSDQTRQIVSHWRSGIIASVPNLARHSRTPEGEPIPEYLAQSNVRFEPWILNTCLRPYDQDWLNYQQKIALRHTSLKKNQVDGVRSTAYVPFHDIVAFIAVMNETIRSYLASKGNTGGSGRNAPRLVPLTAGADCPLVKARPRRRSRERYKTKNEW